MSPQFTLDNLALKRLKEIKTKKKIIPIKLVWIKLCSGFSIKKEDCWRLLKYFENKKKIEIIPYHGIKLKY